MSYNPTSNPLFRLVDTDDARFSSFFARYSSSYTLTGFSDINDDGEFEILYDYRYSGDNMGYYHRNSQNEWVRYGFDLDVNPNYRYGSLQIIDRFRSNTGEKALVIGNNYGTIDYYLETPSNQWAKQEGIANPFRNIELLYSDGSRQQNITIEFVDLDRDSYRDLIVTGNHTIAHYEENSAGQWNKVKDLFNMRSYDSNTNETYSTFNDFDGDGDLDAAIYSDGNFYYMRQNSYHSWSNMTGSHNNPFDSSNLPSGDAVSSSYRIPISHDIDNDGDIDIIFSSRSGSGVRIYENLKYDYDVAFTRVTSTSRNEDLKAYINVGSSLIATQFVDLDNNGEYEVLGGHLNGIIYYNDKNDNGSWTYYNINTPGRIDVGSDSRPFIYAPGKMAVARWNGDILLYNGTWDSSARQWNWEQENENNNPFADVIIARYHNPVFADIDGDGDLDLTVRNGNNIDYYEQESPTSWVKQSGNYFSGVSLATNYNYVLGDFDNDGSIDLITYGKFYSKEGSSWVLQSSTKVGGIINNQYPVVHDLDGDGDLDIYYYANNVYENTLYNPDDAIKVIRHDAKKIDMRSSPTINLDDYFSDTDRGNLTYTIEEQPDFVVLDDNIITFPGGDIHDEGKNSLQVTARNSAGFQTSQAINIYVTHYKANPAPTPDNNFDSTPYDTQHRWSINVNDLFDDPGDELEFTVSESPFFDRQSGDYLYLTTSDTDPGNYSVVVTAEDSLGQTAEATYNFIVAEMNDAPTAPGRGSRHRANEDGRIGYIDLYKVFHDEENDDLNFTFSTLNPVDGFTITHISDGLYTFKATKEYNNGRSFYVSVTAEESNTAEHYSTSTNLSFYVINPVNDTPTAATRTTAIATVNEGAGFSFDAANEINGFGFTDEEGAKLTYDFSDTEDNLKSKGFTINESTGVITASASNTEYDILGSNNMATLTVTASDGNSAGSATLTLTINHVNDPLKIGAGKQTITEPVNQGESVNFDLVAGFGLTDEEEDNDQDATDFSFEVRYQNESGVWVSLPTSETQAAPFYLDGGIIKGDPKNEHVASYIFTVIASDSGHDNSGNFESTTSVTGILTLTVNDINDRPYINPDKLAIIQGKAAYELESYIKGSVPINFNDYFKDKDFLHSEELSFVITTTDLVTTKLFEDMAKKGQGITKDTNASTTTEHVFNVTQTSVSQDAENLLTLESLDTTTGDLEFSIKAKDDGGFTGEGNTRDALESDVLNFKLTVANEYRWHADDTALTIDVANDQADNRADIVAFIDEDATFERPDWESQGNNIILKTVTRDEDNEVTTNIATINNAFASYGPKRFIVKQSDQEMVQFYLNFGYQGNNASANIINAYSGISGTYKELIMPAQDSSEAVTITSGSNENAEYHIYSRKQSTDSDVLTGNSGNDFFYILGEGNNDINGAVGNDTVIYLNQQSNLNITLDSQAPLARGAFSDNLLSVENITVIGTAGKINTLIGTAEANRIEGGDGRDTIIGKGGADQLIGGGGRDYITVTGSEILADGGESYAVGTGEHKDVLRFASDTSLETVSVDYLLNSGGKFINFEEMDLTASGKNFIVELNKDSILEIFGGDLIVSGLANNGVNDKIILTDFSGWVWNEAESTYTYGDEATITLQDDYVDVIEPITPVIHTINIDSTDDPNKEGNEFKFVDNANDGDGIFDDAQVIMDFNPTRNDVLLFKDKDSAMPIGHIIKGLIELPQHMSSWWFTPDQGLRINSGDLGASDASEIFIKPAEGVDFSSITPRYPFTSFDADDWGTVVEALGGTAAFDFA